MLTCCITITTHNRSEDLRRTLDVITQLDPPADEIWIAVDGCTDGTEKFLRAEHPRCNVIVNPVSMGSIPSRNALSRAAKSDLLFSLDDDSYPIERDAIARIRELFEKNPKLAVATFPQRSDEFPETLTQQDFGAARFVGWCTNSGSVIRRSVFLELGGYPDFFRHAYEEPDFGLRCVAAGYEVKFEPVLTVRHHYTGVQRNEMRTHHFHSRNEQWSLWMRCPFPFAPVVSLFRIVRQFNHAAKHGVSWLKNEPRWWWQCFTGLPRAFAHRRPIPWRIYWNWMKLVRHPLYSEAEWKKRFGR